MRLASPGRPATIGLALAATLAAALVGCEPDRQPTAPRAAAPPRAVIGTVVTVTNSNDDGAGSLRQAVADADDGATIQFDPSIAGATIVLSTQLELTQKSVTIEGPPAGGITLSGAGTGRVVHVGGGTIDAPISVVLRNLTITNGRAAPGGGILVNGTLTLDHSTVSGNQAVGDPPPVTTGDGGGIGIGGGSVTLVNSTISGNSTSATAGGGGVGFYSVGSGHARGALTLINSTVAANSAAAGGGILANAGSLAGEQTVVTVRNSIIAGNSATNADYAATANCYVAPVPNVAFDLAGTNLSSDESCGAAGTAMVVADPKLGPLAANGGPTKTQKLLAGSPAIDAATDCTVSDDQRYVARPQGAACDIGAVEFDDYTKVAIVVDPSGTVNSKTGVAIVSGTVACSAPTPLALAVSISQAQKVGKVNTTVQASDVVQVACGAKKAWSVALTPATGAFSNSSARVTAATLDPPADVIAASTTATVKMAWSRR